MRARNMAHAPVSNAAFRVDGSLHNAGVCCMIKHLDLHVRFWNGPQAESWMA